MSKSCNKYSTNYKKHNPTFQTKYLLENIRLSNFFSPKLKLHVPIYEKMVQSTISTVHVQNIPYILVNINADFLNVTKNTIALKTQYLHKNATNTNQNLLSNTGCHLHLQNVDKS